MLSRRLLLLAGEAVDGTGLGRHGLRRAGRTQTFREHRSYLPGDDLRHVDWHVLARKDQLVVKVFEDEAPIRVEVVVDGSGSMGTGGKAERQMVVALSVAQVALSAGEEVGLQVVQQTATGPLLRLAQPGAGLGHLRALSAALAAVRCAGTTPAAEALVALQRSLRRRSHIIVCSDFWYDIAPLGRLIRGLTARRHDVTLVHLWHADEAELPAVGQAQWQGLEGEGFVMGDSEAMRAAFGAKATQHRAALAEACHRAGGVCVAAPSTASDATVVRAILLAQHRLGRRLR